MFVFYLFSEEREKEGVELNECKVGRIWRAWEKEYCDKNILHEKKLFSILERDQITPKVSSEFVISYSF